MVSKCSITRAIFIFIHIYIDTQCSRNNIRFADNTSKINSTQVINSKNYHVVMSMPNLIECRNNYSTAPGILWEYFIDKCKSTFTSNTGNHGTGDKKIPR